MLVRRCDLPNLALRFVILVVIKSCCNTLARLRLGNAMRRTLLGKRTLHGVSDLAAKVAASRALTSNYSANAAADARVGSAARGEIMSDEESRAVQRELSLKNLDHTKLFVSMIRRNHVFYVAVIAFQLFAAFPVARLAPLDRSPSAVRALASVGVVYANGTAAASAAPWEGGGGWVAGQPRAGLGETALRNETMPLPFQMVWMYLHPAITYDLDEQLQAAFLAVDNNRSTCLTAWPWNELGWPRDRSDWER